MLQLALSIKSSNPTNNGQLTDSAGFDENKSPSDAETESSAGTALRMFLTKYQSDPIDIDTAIFERDRATETDRDFRL